MFDWQRLWLFRFQGWHWLALALIACLLGTGLVVWNTASGSVASLALIAGSIIVLGVVLALRQISQSHQTLLQVTRTLAAGRTESRLPADWAGLSGELAQVLNALGRSLEASRSQQEQAASQIAQRLRQDNKQLSLQNQELRRRLRAAEDTSQSQSELFSSLSHELRTPLTGVLGYADMLRKSGLTPLQEQHLSTLDRSARGLLSMINDLLDWSRIEAGRLTLNNADFDVLETLEDTTALLAPLAYEKGLELVRIAYHDVPRVVSGDAQRLRQILTNLLSNAIKFTDRGEIVIRVMRERSDSRGQWLRFAVKDTGRGISAEQQQRLFKPFQQVSRTVGGSGLGLSITRRLVELMGGSVELDSLEERGSTFSVLLPFAVDPEQQPPATRDSRLREQLVWLLEPQATARLALLHWLEFWGLRVRAFEDESTLMQALMNPAIGGLPPALVILGVGESRARHPDFPDLLKLCRSRTPVLALIASVSLDLQNRLRETGAACLTKSASHRSLLEHLQRLTGNVAAPDALTGKQVLVADNNPVNLRYIASLCRDLGMVVTESADGLEALKLWTQQHPDIVLLDARMPGMPGVDVARNIRKREMNQSRCLILAISAHLESYEQTEFLQAGADAILLKPFDSLQLQQALHPKAVTLAARTVSLQNKLTQDPELLQLLQEELPQQLSELETAWRTGEPQALRDAAHQLHGTAAFYHLTALKECCSLLERSIAQKSLPDELTEALDALRAAVGDTLNDIEQLRASEPS